MRGLTITTIAALLASTGCATAPDTAAGNTAASTPAPQPNAAGPQIALTFDDMPAHGPLPPGVTRVEVVDAIIAALQAHDAPAFGFVNGSFGTDDPTSPQVLAAWRRAGFPLGNHSFSHGNLDTVGAQAFTADIARNEGIVAGTMPHADWHWFRYPFLAEGQKPADRDAVRSWLGAHGYRVAAVTMSFGDYGWNAPYARCVAKRDGATIANLESSYLAAARDQAQSMRHLSQAALGRDIPYVLLMHLGAFDAHMLPRLLDLYRQMGFGFIPLASAERDPFYAGAISLDTPGPTPTLNAAAAARGIAVASPEIPLPGDDICT